MLLEPTYANYMYMVSFRVLPRIQKVPAKALWVTIEGFADENTALNRCEKRH